MDLIEISRDSTQDDMRVCRYKDHLRNMILYWWNNTHRVQHKIMRPKNSRLMVIKMVNQDCEKLKARSFKNKSDDKLRFLFRFTIFTQIVLNIFSPNDLTVISPWRSNNKTHHHDLRIVHESIMNNSSSESIHFIHTKDIHPNIEIHE